MKKRAVEVSEKRLTAADLEKFHKAKMIEVKNFIAAEAFEALPEHLKPSREQAVGMRWILTWKCRIRASPKLRPGPYCWAIKTRRTNIGRQRHQS